MSFGWAKNSGLVCLFRGAHAINFAVKRSHWMWGRSDGWWNGPIVVIGLGPIFLYTYTPGAPS